MAEKAITFVLGGVTYVSLEQIIKFIKDNQGSDVTVKLLERFK